METHIVRKQQPVWALVLTSLLCCCCCNRQAYFQLPTAKHLSSANQKYCQRGPLRAGRSCGIFFIAVMLKVFFVFCGAKTNWSHIEQLRRGERYRLHADIWRSLVPQLHRLKIWNHFSQILMVDKKKFPKAHRISVGFLRFPSCSTNESNSHIKVNRGEKKLFANSDDERDRNVDDCRKFDDFPKTTFCSLSSLIWFMFVRIFYRWNSTHLNPSPRNFWKQKTLICCVVEWC